MPFDTTKLRQPVVTVLPATRSEAADHNGSMCRSRSCNGSRHSAPQAAIGSARPYLTLLVIVLLAALLGCAQAHAQPSSWQSYREGFMTLYQGTDRDGGQWTGSSYKQGFTTYFDAND